MEEHTGNDVDVHTVKPVDTGKGKSTRKGKPKPLDKDKGKRSLNLSLPVDDYERFALHALRMTGGNISELVCQLGRAHLREYHLSRTPTRAAGE